jgi:hypothetical protein
MISKERLHIWRQLCRIEPIHEDPQVLAGRRAEDFLHQLVRSNLKYKDAHCFIGKRIPSPRDRRRYEIDLIVLTKKQLHVIEVKNWSGELFIRNDQWIQRKRNGEEIEHPDLAHYNARKMQALTQYLQSHGVEVPPGFIRQTVLFMHPGLRMSHEIASHPNVIPRAMLDDYLNSQRGISMAERMLHSVVEACLNMENSKVVLEGLFKALHSHEIKNAVTALSALHTWDRVCFYGGKVEQGDMIGLTIRGEYIGFKSLSAGDEVKLKWVRGKFWSLAWALLTEWPMGRAKYQGKTMILDIDTDYIHFHRVGDAQPVKIGLAWLCWLSRG